MTTLINIYAGPCRAKTTTAWRISAALSESGSTVFCPTEPALSVYISGKDPSKEADCAMIEELAEAIVGAVKRNYDYVVIDAPFITHTVYSALKGETCAMDMGMRIHDIMRDGYPCYNICMVGEPPKWRKEGSPDDEARARVVNDLVEQRLDEHCVYCVKLEKGGDISGIVAEIQLGNTHNHIHLNGCRNHG